MIINGKYVPFESCIRSNNTNTGEYIWVAYDDSRARLPVAIAPTADELARITGRTRSCVESAWCHYRLGHSKNTKYAKVYIGEEEND